MTTTKFPGFYVNETGSFTTLYRRLVNGVIWKDVFMNDAKRKHLNMIADALIRAGFDVEKIRPECEYLDVWGFESTPGRKRRRRCFEEIYCTVIEVGALAVSYWSTNKTYDAQSDNIEIEQTASGLRGMSNLIAHLSVQPIRKAVQS